MAYTLANSPSAEKKERSKTQKKERDTKKGEDRDSGVRGVRLLVR